MTRKSFDGPGGSTALGLFAGVIVVWAVSGYWLAGKGLQERGTFGDMFGAVNALFSGLAFAGVIIAILLQRGELRLQREELTLTREELVGQKEALNAQNKTLQKQNFETTFFQLLTLHNDLVNGIDLVSKGTEGGTTPIRGRDCFKVFYKKRLGRLDHDKPGPPGETTVDRINRIYMVFYADHQHDIGHYFRTLYNIVKFVDRSDVPDKRFYTNLIRAQMSSFELLLLFYNCLSEMGREKFKPLIEKYALLKTMPRNELLEPAAESGLYDPGAYGEQEP
jgi:hypothetical protein